jgi:hypothetical protein
MYVFKIYTIEPITFQLTEKQYRCEFVNKQSHEFKSLLRSPHANKNSQEQFHKLKYIYTIKISSQKRAEHFLTQLKTNQTDLVLSVLVYYNESVIYTSNC